MTCPANLWTYARAVGLISGMWLVCLPGLAAGPDFAADIAPLLARRCLSCHAGDDPQGGLNLTRRTSALAGGDSGPGIILGDPDGSPLWERIDAGEMPPDQPLPAAERRLIRDWLTAGAAWDVDIDPLKYTSGSRAGYDWWSLQPLRRVVIPESEPDWSRNPIDRFISAQRRAAGLTAAPEADRRVLIRRLSFDLLGLPPTPDEVEQFVSDVSPDAYEQLVERLLSSPHYGERWGRHWLDVVRFGESNGFERDLPRPHAWHYRDWVIDALNRDLPYDEFVRWQLAGDVIAPDAPESRKALGFLAAGPHDTVIPVNNRMRQVMRQDEMEDLIGVVSQTFLGLTVNCARCHDHKFDPIPARDYYQLAAVFAGIEQAEQTVMPVAAQRQLERWQADITERDARLQAQTRQLFAALVKDTNTATTASAPVILPTPYAEWDFTIDLQDRRGHLPARWVGQGTRSQAGIELDGTAYVATAALPDAIREKTLEVRVRLADLEQRGGGVMSLQSLDGAVFDAVVFGEQEPYRWLAGSNFFSRTASFKGPSEGAGVNEFITVTYVYDSAGTITACRNGRLYGQGYASSGPVKFAAGESQVLFGLRHGSPGGNRMFRGTIAAAKLYDQALSLDQVRASLENAGNIVNEEELTAGLTAAERQQRQQDQTVLERLRQQAAELRKSAPYQIYTVSLNQPTETQVLRRGNVTDPGDVVSPAGLSAIVGHAGDLQLRTNALEQPRRERLANWITAAENALFARVMANRLWQYHFGTGLVATANDLGFNGGLPSHPELLDWLARELIDSGYSLKHLHRLMIMSATYRQSSHYREEAAAWDADNRLLWRMSPRRLDAESLRDALLFVSEELNTTLGGRSYADFNSYFFKGTQFYDPVDPAGYETQRRTVYRMWARGGRNPFLDTFDCPDPSTTTPLRSVTTTPLQALSLLNNPLTRRLAERMANQIIAEAGEDIPAQVERAYERLFQRKPTADELTYCREFIKSTNLAAACLGWMNSSEFLYVD